MSTLRKFINNAVGRLQTGFSDVMFRLLHLRVSDLPLCDRQCALVFDEMSLKQQLTFDKNWDKIVGYTEGGNLATHALVFMVRGLRTKWKQALAFFFTHNTIASSKLPHLIKDCVTKLFAIGLFVRCLVCDQGATNVAAVKQMGFSVDSPRVLIANLPHKVHVIFDVPHLLKNVRNNLQRHDIQVGDSTASWKHVDHFYRIDKMSPIRLAPKLTDRHIDLGSASKMRVSLAAQVLSHSVAAGIKMRIITKELAVDAAFTAEFIENIDKLFDLLNSRLLKADRPARCAVTASNKNLQDLLTLKQWVDKWRFIGARAPSAIHSHWGLQVSIVSIHALCEELMAEGFKFICTSRLNQDCVENFFACMRSKQGWNENPTAFQFAAAFRNAVVLSSLDSTSSGTNCIADDDVVILQEVSWPSAEAQPSTSVGLSNSVTSSLLSDDVVWEEMTNEVLNSDICYEEGVTEIFTEAEESLISYLSGWLARKCGICPRCQVVLCKRLGDHSYCCRPIDDFANVKRFVGSASVGLVEPCEELFSAVHVMENVFRINYSAMCTLPAVAMCLFNAIYPCCDFNFLFVQHPEHACYLSEKLTKMYIVMRIYYAVKFQNRTLLKSSLPDTDTCSTRRSSTQRKMQKVLHL